MKLTDEQKRLRRDILIKYMIEKYCNNFNQFDKLMYWCELAKEERVYER